MGSKNFDAGYLAGEFLGKALDGKGKVAILNGIPVVPILERVKEFKDAISKFPGITVATVQNGKQERDVALSVTENIIQSTPISREYSVSMTVDPWVRCRQLNRPGKILRW